MRPQENIAKVFIAPDIAVKSFDLMGKFFKHFRFLRKKIYKKYFIGIM